MQFFLMIAAALLGFSLAAPINSEEESKKVYSGAWGLNPLQNVTQVDLPEADKEKLCHFLATFEITKMQLFGAIFAANMEFMKSVETQFEKDFKEYQENHPSNLNESQQLEEFIGDGVNPIKIYREESIYKKKFYKDIGKVFEGVNESFIKEAQKVKGNLTKETAESEVGFFERFEGFKVPSKKAYNDKSELINIIEREFKFRYQCPGQ